MSVQTLEHVQPLRFAAPVAPQVPRDMLVDSTTYFDELRATVDSLTGTIDRLTETLENLPQDTRTLSSRRVVTSVRHAQALLTAARAVTTHIAY